MVYVSTKNGLLAAVETKTSQIVWTQQDCRSAVIATQGVVNRGGRLFHAFDGLTGTMLWDLECVGTAFHPAMVDGSTVYFVGTDRQIYALDVATREMETVAGSRSTRRGHLPLIVDRRTSIDGGFSRQESGVLLAIGDESSRFSRAPHLPAAVSFPLPIASVSAPR